MPYLHPISRELLPDGLYLVTQYQKEKGVLHAAIADVGNCSGLATSPFGEPTILHLPATGYSVEALSAAGGTWDIVRRLEDQRGAIERIKRVHSKPEDYSLISNNCEHYTEYVENGVPKSPQVVKTVLFVATAAGLVWALSKLASQPNRGRRTRA